MRDSFYIPLSVMSTMFSETNPDAQYPLEERFVKEIGGWNFLSRRRLKHQIPNLQLSPWCLSINKVICADGKKPTHFTSRSFNLFEESQRADFVVELGNLADLHGIIKLRKGNIWVREATDPKQLNIDPRVMDCLMERIDEQCRLGEAAEHDVFASHLMGWAKNP